MKPVISFVEIENRVISATYRRLMVRAKVVLVEKASGRQLPEPVTTIASPVPVGAVRIKLPETVKPGTPEGLERAWRRRGAERGFRDRLSRWISTVSA
jgi:hypothetical protein